MGIEYTFANRKNKTAYEVGRGSWYALVDSNTGGDASLLYLESILDTIKEEVFSNELDEEYLKRIAQEIYDFVDGADPSEIFLCNDCNDSNYDIRAEGYRWVGSRYESQSIEELNRHLDKNK